MPAHDFTEDPVLAFLPVLKKANALPDYVTEVPEKADLENLPNIAFADSNNRTLPVHDKQAAFLSAVQVICDDLDGAFVGRLKTACAAYGIEDDVRAAHTALAAARPEEPAVVKEASESTDGKSRYALELHDEPGGPAVGYYPIYSARHVGESAQKMATDMAEAKLPLAWFADAASELLKAASDTGYPVDHIPMSVRRCGQNILPAREVLDREIELRKEAGVSEDDSLVYKEAADGVNEGNLTVTEGALVWQAADRKLGIHEKFSGSRDPLWAFKSGHTEEYIEKVKSATVMIGDTLIPKMKLDGVSDNEVVRIMNPEDARSTLLAKRASDGAESTRILGEVSETGIAKLAGLLLRDHVA